MQRDAGEHRAVLNRETEFQWFVGIDWGAAHHAIDVGDAAGHGVAERTVEHTSAGLAEFVAWLTHVAGGQLARVAVGIEVPRGALVELLLERGAAVFALNPKQLDRFRDRFSVAGAKDDRLDARVLRSAVQTDRHHFRRLQIDEPLVIQVRELTRAAEVLQQEFGGLTNRLRELVHRIAPEWLTLSANADDPWFWRFVEYAATPTLGRRLGRAKIERLLKHYRIRRVTPDVVLRVLAAPALIVAPGTVEAVTGHIQLLLRRVRLVHEQHQRCERELAAALAMLASTAVAEDSSPPAAPSSGPGERARMASAAIRATWRSCSPRPAWASG